MRKAPKCHTNRRYWARDMCNSCYKKWWRESHPEQELATRKSSIYETPQNKRERAIANRYGINQTQYLNMLTRQNYVCAICGKTDSNKSLCIDHCHKTGNIRGLLCTKCNKGLGHFNDEVVLLQKSIEYLKCGTSVDSVYITIQAVKNV